MCARGVYDQWPPWLRGKARRGCKSGISWLPVWGLGTAPCQFRENSSSSCCELNCRLGLSSTISGAPSVGVVDHVADGIVAHALKAAEKTDLGLKFHRGVAPRLVRAVLRTPDSTGYPDIRSVRMHVRGCIASGCKGLREAVPVSIIRRSRHAVDGAGLPLWRGEPSGSLIRGSPSRN